MTITITLICIFLYSLLSIFLHFVYMFDLSLIIFWAKQGSFYRVSMLSCFSHVRLFVTLCTVAHQAPLFMGFPRQKYWSELPCPPPGDLLDLGIEAVSLMSPTLGDGFFTTSHLGNLHMPGGIIENHTRNSKDFSSGPVVKTSPPNTGLAGSNPV